MGKSLYFGFPGEEWTRQGSRLRVGCFEQFRWALEYRAVASCLESGLVLTSAGGYSEYENAVWKVVGCVGSGLPKNK